MRRILSRVGLELLLAILVIVLFAGYLFGDDLLYGSDSIPAGLFFRSLNVDFVREFLEFPKWNPYILGGLPYIDATHGDTFFPSSILHFLMPVYRGMGHKLIFHIFLAGVFMAFYLRTLGLRREAIGFGGITYMLCPILVSYLYAGQDGKMYVVSLTPLVLGLAERALLRQTSRSYLLLGLSIGLLVLSAQIQMAYHCMWFLAGLFLLRLSTGAVPAGGEADRPRPRPVRNVVGFGAAIVLGLLVSSVQLVPAVAYVRHPDGFSVRSTKTDYAHAASWSLHPEEIASMVVPEFCNAPEGYWGRNIFKYNSDYLGLVTLVLAASALLGRRNPTRWFMAGLGVFSVAYSLGEHTPLHRLFYHVVPQVKLFRAPPLVMFGAAFGGSVLAALGVQDLLAARARTGTGRRDSRRDLPVLVGCLAGAALLLGASAEGRGLVDTWIGLFYPGITPEKSAVATANLPAFRTGALAAAAILAACGAILWAARSGRLRGPAAVLLLGLLTVIDLWRVDDRFQVTLDTNVYPPPRNVEGDVFLRPDPLVERLQSETEREKFRVMPVDARHGSNNLGLFGVESVLGFHDNELSWYRRLRSAPEAGGLLAVSGNAYPFLRMLNVKYILHDNPQHPNPLPVPDYNPRFWMTDSYEVIAAPDEIPARIADPEFDVGRSVVLEAEPDFPSGSGSGAEPGRVVSYAYEGNRIRVEVSVDRPCVLVQSENWFPYWNVKVDGHTAPLLRVNGVIRGIELAPGAREVELAYRSPPYEAGKAITLTSLGIVALLGAVGAIRSRARRG
jgi:hypothetical protein